MKISIEGIDFRYVPKNIEEQIRKIGSIEFKEINDMTPEELQFFNRVKKSVEYNRNAKSSILSEENYNERQQEDMADSIANSIAKALNLPGVNSSVNSAEFKALQEDRAYWIARAKVLESMLLKVSPDSAAIERKIHMEFLTRMVREEMFIRTRSRPNEVKFIEEVDQQKRWNDPYFVMRAIRKIYDERFQHVLGKPLDADGNEPYWQQYVKTVASLSPKHESFVKQTIVIDKETQDEWNERMEVIRGIRDRLFHYLDSIYYDASADRQKWIEEAKRNKILEKINAMIPTTMFSDDVAAFISESLPEKMGFDVKGLTKEYDQANAVRYVAAVELYLVKLKEIKEGKMTEDFTWKNGFQKTYKTPPIEAPENFEFDGATPGMR